MTPITALLAEDHETVRLGLRALLQTQPDIVIVDEVADGLSAVERARELQPRVVVLDITMPGMSGLEATRAIKDAAPAVSVIAFTRHDDDAFVSGILDSGASGYVLKQSPGEELLEAIRVVAGGGCYLDSALAGRALQQHDRNSTSSRVSDRELTVLRRMAIGFSNKEIAAELNISVKTVEAHKANAMRKLALRGRVDVVRYAMLHGWFDQR